MNYGSASWKSQNGWLTYRGNSSANGYGNSKPQIQSNSWSSTENSSNNAWNVNFNSGNTNANNKYNSNVVRPVSASCVPKQFLDSVIDAYYDCCKGKTSSRQCMDYYDRASDDIPVLASELWNDTYQPGTSTCFLVSYPKWREVFAADFRDRIVHHWLINFLNPLFEQRFTETHNVSYNCRKGYGTHRAVRDAARGIARVSQNYHRPAYLFRGDMVGFFMSIDQDVMWALMMPFIENRYQGPWKDMILSTMKKIIFHRPEKNCVLNTDPIHWRNLTANKSLFRTPEHKGMPIGNLTTQIFANFYMSYFDEYVLSVFRGHNFYYIRFVDDFLLCCDDKKFLLRQVPLLSEFLTKTLHLKMHNHKHYFQPATHGISFVGAYIKPHRIYVSNRTRARLIERIHGFNAFLYQPVPVPDASASGTFTSADLHHIETVLNSYLGFCKHCRSYRVRKQALAVFSKSFYKYFYIRVHHSAVHLKNKYRSPYQ